MAKTVTINQDKLLMLKEDMVGNDNVTSHNDVDGSVKLYHGTSITSLVNILKTKEVCANKGRQHGETNGLNWFSLVNDGNFNRGVCFSIEVPIGEFNEKFHKMNRIHVTSKDSSLDISNYNIQVEYFCGFGREAIIRYYERLVENGERYPIEQLRDSVFYNWCEGANNLHTYREVSDYDFGLIMANILGDDAVRKDGFLMEAAPEVDEYEIGDEGSNPPVGGNFYHVNESYNVSVRGDLDSINTIEFIPHEDAREEGYEDDEIEDFEPYYEVEAMDMDGNTILYADLTVEELFDYFPQSVINDIVERDKSNSTRLANPSINLYRIDDILYRETTPSDINDVEEVNKIAKKIQTGGPSAYLLTDGEYIYFHDHCYISSVDGMNVGKFLDLGNIRLGSKGGIELAHRPTSAQIDALKEFSRRNEGNHYLDIVKYKEGSFYPEHVCSARYINANPNKLIGDILNYFDEGIRPQGNRYYESKDGEMIIESTFEEWFGGSILKDENGKPLKMYHGTDAEFDSFSKEYIGSTGSYEGYGFNFTPFESRAMGYNSKRVIEAYLRVTNPMTSKSNKITLRQLTQIIKTLDEGKPYTDTIVAAYEPARYNEKWDERYYMRALPMAARTIYQYNKESEYGDAGLYAEICVNGNADKFKTIETFEKLGYDSVIFYDNDDRINTVVVFEPNQIKKTNNKTYKLDSDLMGENFNFEVNSSEVDLSSFKKRHELAPNIWKPNGELNSRVRLKLLDIADDFWKCVNLTWVKPSGIILTGSICNFNWSQYSDIDLHLIVDFDEIDEKTEFVKDYLDAKKNEWNDEHSGLQIMGYKVELYVQNLGETLESDGVYDLEENDWIREPNPNNIKQIGLNKFSIKEKAAKIMTIIDDMYDALASTDDSHKIEEIGDDASYLWRKVKEMRKEGLRTDGESSSANIVYKYIRRQGYLDKLWKLRTMCYDKFNSISETKKSKKKVYIDEEKLPLIVESQESKSIAQAKALVMKRLGYSSEQADDFIRIKLRNDMPSLRTPQGGKFILGVARMFCDRELRDANTIGNLDKTIKLVASDAHINEYDRNLNGMSAQDLISRFEGARGEMLDADMSSLASIEFQANNDYDIVRIDSFEQSMQYGDYTSWCVTHDENMFDSYTQNGINQFYFCLKHGFEGVKKVQSEGCPLDEYGLSMIAVSVDGNGALSTCTCRWNHDNGGNDSIMDTKQISAVIGTNFYNVFKPNNKWKMTLSSAMERLSNGEPLEYVFDGASRLKNGLTIVLLSEKWNFINEEGRLISDKWFDSVGEFNGGLAMVYVNGKYNFINQEGRTISNQWFDYASDFNEGFGIVKLNHKYNFINQEGRTISNHWFDYAYNFKEGFFRVYLNEKYNFINQEGRLLSNKWFDKAFDFYEGFGMVKLNHKYNFINQEGRTISNQWFDYAYDFNEGFARVYLNEKYNFINQEGRLLSNKWFHKAYDFYEGFARVRLNGERHLIDTNGHIVQNESKEIGKKVYIGEEKLPLLSELQESKPIENKPFLNESVKRYITLLKEETVADGSSNGNPYRERWKTERETLKNFICNYGTVMQSKEDNKGGKIYKCFWDKGISQLIGYNYCLCVQWDEISLKPKSVVYVRALDKFTPNIRRNLVRDTRGMDNLQGTYDDVRYRNY